MNKNTMAMAVAMLFALAANAATEYVDGYTWEYTVSSGRATITGVSPESGNIVIPSSLNGYPVKAVGDYAFNKEHTTRYGVFDSIIIPDGVESIGTGAFLYLYTKILIPKSVRNIGAAAFRFNTIRWEVSENVTFPDVSVFQHVTFDELIFQGAVPESLELVLLNSEISFGCFKCRRMFGNSVMGKMKTVSIFAGYIDDAPEVEIVSSAVRENDPTVMDVVYKVYSDKARVKVRALAFQDGQRNLAKAVPVKTLIEGTDVNIGDSIAANVEHKLSWKVSADWATDLAKVKFEVLAVEDDLLPLELQTIPATANHAAMKISWNRLTDDKVFDALLWLYADGDTGLTLTNGQLKNGGTILASGTGIYNGQSAVAYVFGKMGYGVLSGSDLTYARRVTQLDLPVGGIQQYAVKMLAQ